MNLQNVCEAVNALCVEVGAFIAHEASVFDTGSVEIKSFNQLVSYVDKTAEEKLVAGLGAILPEAGFITEENTVAPENKEYTWVIDPLDGTTNFIHRLPVYSISIGLLRNDTLVLGVVYEVNRKELFYSWEGGKAYLNGKEIRVTDNDTLGASLLATGFPYYDFHIMQQYLDALHQLMRSSRGMRRMGSAAVDLAYVACGRFDGFFEYGLSPWDVAGGAFIVKQAGGTVTDFSGGGNYVFGKEIIAAGAAIHPSFSAVINKAFSKDE